MKGKVRYILCFGEKDISGYIFAKVDDLAFQVYFCKKEHFQINFGEMPIFKSVNYWYIFERRAWSAKKGVKEGSGERSPERGRFGRGDSELSIFLTY